jgi:hypothetical protein
MIRFVDPRATRPTNRRFPCGHFRQVATIP